MASLEIGNFDRDLKQSARKFTATGAEAIRSMAIKLYSELQRDAKEAGNSGSPIASGRYVASMRMGINEIDYSYEPADPSYEYDRNNLAPRTIRNKPISSIAAKLRTYKLGDDIFISNSVPYVRKIEVDGHSWQAPGGVFGPTIRKVSVQFENVAARIVRV